MAWRGRAVALLTAALACLALLEKHPNPALCVGRRLPTSAVCPQVQTQAVVVDDVQPRVRSADSEESGLPQDEVEKQLQELRDGAARDDPESLYKLALVLRKGRYVERDLEKAFALFRRAGDLEHLKATLQTGIMLQQGIGTAKNEEEALDYLTMAAEEGSVKGQFLTGMCHLTGSGLGGAEKRDIVCAAYWIKRAADRGYAAAQYQTADMLLADDGIRRNETGAAEYYALAAQQGHLEAQEALGHMYRNGVGVEQSIELAIHWLRKSAEQGNAEAYWTLACLFRKGDAVEKDSEGALTLLTMAGNLGHVEAARECGVMYLTGEGTDADEELAGHWFHQADLIEEGGVMPWEDAPA